ncbi:DUF2970 domain-containing protein [Legionella saoudiensis]|uniref:DUF2970 domain-containing protein n=1 Tax=Legionella saoudiensis TaxID=1750561 RepID=UPI0007309340|nr:DUF2970 domain-containing protein [Legionella saoudiensis]
MYERIIGVFLLLLSLGGYWPINYHLHCQYRDSTDALTNCRLTASFYRFPLHTYHLSRITQAGVQEEDSRRKRYEVIYHLYLKGNYDKLYFLNLYSTNLNEISFLASEINNYITSGTQTDFDIPRFKHFIILEILTIALFIFSLILIILGDKIERLIRRILNLIA